jgi:zinc protease
MRTSVGLRAAPLALAVALAGCVTPQGDSVAGASAAAAPQAAAAAAPAQPAWPHAASDVPADESVRFGVLPNGMRYALRRNATPPGATSLRLRIDAGSIHEEEDQRGVAHFLEHLVLNETKNLPEGELLRTLERAGLQFGADTNASTGFEQTIFKLDLPRTDAQLVDTGLMLMREVASEATLRDAVIDSERGIILSEERSRANPQLRLAQDELAYLFGQDRLGNRLPIGSPDVIRTVPRQRIADFYRAYYRPERATLVAVGDFDVDALEAKIREKFQSWQGEGRPGADLPPLVTGDRGLETDVFVEAGVPSRVLLGWVSPRATAPDSRARRAENVRRDLALTVLNRRLERLAAGETKPFIAGIGVRARIADRADVVQLFGITQPGAWQPAVGTLEQEHRRLLEHGITAPELSRAVNDVRAQLQAQVSGAVTRGSADLAEQIVGAVNEDDVFAAPATQLALFEEAVAGLTGDQVAAAYRAMTGGREPLLQIASPQPIEGGEAALRTAFAQARQVPVAAPAVQSAAAWPYSSFGTPGEVAERRELAEVGATSVRFANGVRLIVKPTQFADDEVLLAARFDGGAMALPKRGPTAAWSLPLQAFVAGGTGKLAAEELQEVLTGKVVAVTEALTEDALVLGGKTRPQDLATQLQLMAAYATDPGFRPATWERYRAFSGTIQDQYESGPGGILSRDLGSLLRGGDPRWATPSREQMAAMPASALSDLLRGPLTSAPIEVVIVGDISVDEAVRQTAATFGALPARGAAPSRTPFRFPAAASVTRTHKGRADQALAFIAWPTTGFYVEPRQARALDLLSRVVALRLTEEIRERQGTSYSPQAGHEASDELRDYGYLYAVVEAPPQSMESFFRDVEAIARSLREQPVSADELERAKRPLLEQMNRSRNSSNQFWLQRLGEAGSDAAKLATIGAGPAQVEATTAADLQRLARTYLVDGKAWRLSVLPQTP